MLNTRCAVVVGVGKTGSLAALESPVPGAKAIAKLFSDNSYDVALLTDEETPVTTADVAKAIKEFIDRSSINGYRLFVLYFSGHGYWKMESDLWLLSHAPTDADEAISVHECADLAQDSGINNIVIISDACRSTPTGKCAARVRGSLVFPNLNGHPSRRSKIDKLIACHEGAAAYETRIGGNGTESVFTYCLLRAFEAPDPDMLLTVNQDGKSFQVVPNRRLETFLIREVESVLQAINVKLAQHPIVDVTSDEAVYLARVAGKKPVQSQPITPPAVTTIVDLGPKAAVAADAFDFKVAAGGILELPFSTSTSAAELIRHAVDLSVQSPARPITKTQLDQLRKSGREGKAKRPRSANSDLFEDLAENLSGGGLGLAAKLVSGFDSGAGFTLTGATIKSAVLNKSDFGGKDRGVAEVRDRGVRKDFGVIRVWLDGLSCSTMLLVLGNGRGIPLAVLAGYVGHIRVRNGRVQSISYIPGDPGLGQLNPARRWDMYNRNRDKLERLRALAASLVAGQRLRFGTAERAAQVASVLRDVKAVDPMLGLFAVYAYLEASRDDQIEDVRGYMINDLSAELFDVALLARRRSSSTNSVVDVAPLPVAPYCPILKQGWSYLRSRGFTLPPLLAEAQYELQPGPFTTFSSRYTEKLVDAMSK